MAVTTPATALGTPCPDVRLPAVDDRMFSLSDFKNARCLLVVFVSNACPYARAVEDRIISLQHAFIQSELQVVAICSNDPATVPEDSGKNLLDRWREKKMPFPLLVDADQTAAKAFAAVCTPDFFLYDHERALRYRGRLDDNWKEPQKVREKSLQNVVEALLTGRRVPETQHPSIGCSIKWRA